MLNPTAERTREEPFLTWAKREWVLVVITTGIALDWLPWVATPLVPQFGALSGTKLFVLPGLAMAYLRRPNSLLRPHVLGVVYLATMLIGGGLGWTLGTVATERLVTILVNGFILAYYLQIRSMVSLQRVLWIVFVCSIFIPVIQSLTRIGIISTDWIASAGLSFEDQGTRIFSIFDSTTVGFAPLIIPACLGGLIFLPAWRRTALNRLAALGLVGLGLMSPLVAQQRSGVLAYTVTWLVAVAPFVLARRKGSAGVLVAMAFAGALLVVFGRDFARPAQERFSDAAAYEDAKALRLGGAITFVSDLLRNPINPVPIGHQSLLDRTGVEPHLLVSEASYEGGPLFLLAIVIILIRFTSAAIAMAESGEPRTQMVGMIVSAFGAGALVQVSLQTALGLRLVPLLLGVGIAGQRILRAETYRS